MELACGVGNKLLNNSMLEFGHCLKLIVKIHTWKMHFSTPERKDESYCFNNQGSKMRLTRQMNRSSFVHEYHCRQLAMESALLTMIKKKHAKSNAF